MPKTPMNKYCQVVSREDYVRLSGEILFMNPKAKPHCVEGTPHSDFRSSVYRFIAPHYFSAILGCHFCSAFRNNKRLLFEFIT